MCTFYGHFPGKPGSAGSRLILIQVDLKFLPAGCPSGSRTNSVKAVKNNCIVERLNRYQVVVVVVVVLVVIVVVVVVQLNTSNN